MEYASNAKGNLGVTLGAIGTGLAALGGNGSGLLGGILGGGSQYVNKEAYEVQLKLIQSERDNAILSSNLNTETKIVDAFKASVDRENKIRDELAAQIAAVSQNVQNNAAAQAVINTQVNSQMALNTSQIAQLFSLCTLKISNSNVCPGWGPVTVTPTWGGTTTA